jgi:hypothetical protein
LGHVAFVAALNLAPEMHVGDLVECFEAAALLAKNAVGSTHATTTVVPARMALPAFIGFPPRE